jgi:hypothetical protein
LCLFLEGNHSIFASFISTSNKLPYVFSYVFSSIAIIIVSYFVLKKIPNVYAMIIPMFVVQLLYNNWKWPLYVTKELCCSFWELSELGFNTLRIKFITFTQKYNL